MCYAGKHHTIQAVSWSEHRYNSAVLCGALSKMQRKLLVRVERIAVQTMWFFRSDM